MNGILKRVALCAMVSATTTAMAGASDNKAQIKSMSFNADAAIGAIHVASTGRQRWDTIKAGSVSFDASMAVDTRYPGVVVDVGVVLGQCGGAQCNAMPLLHLRSVVERDFSGDATIALPTTAFPPSTGGIPLVADGDAILARCNTGLQADGPTRTFSFDHEFRATFFASTTTAAIVDNVASEANGPGDHYLGRIDHTRSDTVTARVICDPVVKPASNDIAADSGLFRPEAIDLFLATFNGQSSPNAATVCDGLRVTTRVETSKAGPVDIRLWRSAEGAISQVFKSAWSSYDPGKNGYFAEFVDAEHVGRTTNVQYMAEVVGDAFAPSTPWKAVTVHCTGAGGGGLSGTSNDAGRDPIPPSEPDPQVNIPTDADGFASEDPQRPDTPAATWTAQLTIADSAGSRKSCPRKAQVFAEAARNQPGAFVYKISCSNGASFGGEAASFNQGGPGWEAYATHEFNVNRTRKVACTLQEVLPGGSRRTVATDSFDFTCNNPAVDPDADDLVGSLPEPEPAKPAVSILCAPGFRLVGEACVRKPVVVAPCGPDEKRVGGKCVDKPSVSIFCAPGFKLVGKTCVKKPEIATSCKANEKLVRGDCVPKPGVSILCKPGFKLVGKTCVKKPVIATACAANQKLVRGKCVAKPDVSIFCLDGLVPKNGKCVKPAKPLRLGAKAARKNGVR